MIVQWCCCVVVLVLMCSCVDTYHYLFPHKQTTMHNPTPYTPRQQPHTPTPTPHIRVGDKVMEKELIYEKLPSDIAERHVLLMDPILATGNSAAKAIKVLLLKGVQEEKILFLSLVAAPEGITKICSEFPKVKVITSEIDDRVGDDSHVVPGVGEFGERYFGA